VSWDDMNFCDRKQIRMELSLGMMSEENALGRLQIIQKCQNDLYQATTSMVQAGTLTKEIYQKVKKPFADTLYVLGVKDADTYLPSDDEVEQMIAQGAEAMKNKEPSPEDKKRLSSANLDDVKAKQIQAEIAGEDAESQMDFMALAMGEPKVYS
jgi:N-acetylmuramic acid 6-phosphate (MurNAc-6-P) etherase